MMDLRAVGFRATTLRKSAWLLALSVGGWSLLFHSTELYAYEDPAMWQLTAEQEAQLRLEYLELSNGQLFCELRDDLAAENDVSIVFSKPDSLSPDQLYAIIELRPFADTTSPASPIVVTFRNDSAGGIIAQPEQARRDIEALAARHPVEPRSATFPCGPSSFCEGPNLFVPKALSVTPSVWILNRSTAQAGWGVDLFSRSRGVASYVYIDPLRSYNYVAVSDPNADRIMCAEDAIAGVPGKGVEALGVTGSGTNQFRLPRGICIRDSSYISADWLRMLMLQDDARVSYSEDGAKGNTWQESFNGRFKGENGSIFHGKSGRAHKSRCATRALLQRRTATLILELRVAQEILEFARGAMAGARSGSEP